MCNRNFQRLHKCTKDHYWTSFGFKILIFGLVFYGKITFWDILTPCCAKIVDMGMYHHLNLKVQVLTLLKIFKSVFQYIFCSQNNHFLAVWFLGVIFKLFLTPHREGEKVPEIFLAENERSHQYASNKVQTITYKRFLLTQSTFLSFFGLTCLHDLPPMGCAINKLGHLFFPKFISTF